MANPAWLYLMAGVQGPPMTISPVLTVQAVCGYDTLTGVEIVPLKLVQGAPEEGASTRFDCTFSPFGADRFSVKLEQAFELSPFTGTVTVNAVPDWVPLQPVGPVMLTVRPEGTEKVK